MPVQSSVKVLYRKPMVHAVHRRVHPEVTGAGNAEVRRGIFEPRPPRQAGPSAASTGPASEAVPSPVQLPGRISLVRPIAGVGSHADRRPVEIGSKGQDARRGLCPAERRRPEDDPRDPRRQPPILVGDRCKEIPEQEVTSRNGDRRRFLQQSASVGPADLARAIYHAMDVHDLTAVDGDGQSFEPFEEGQLMAGLFQ